MLENAHVVKKKLIEGAESFARKMGDGCCTAMPAQTKTKDSQTQVLRHTSRHKNRLRMTIAFADKKEAGSMYDDDYDDAVTVTLTKNGMIYVRSALYTSIAIDEKFVRNANGHLLQCKEAEIGIREQKAALNDVEYALAEHERLRHN